MAHGCWSLTTIAYIKGLILLILFFLGFLFICSFETHVRSLKYPHYFLFLSMSMDLITMPGISVKAWYTHTWKPPIPQNHTLKRIWFIGNRGSGHIWDMGLHRLRPRGHPAVSRVLHGASASWYTVSSSCHFQVQCRDGGNVQEQCGSCFMLQPVPCCLSDPCDRKCQVVTDNT